MEERKTDHIELALSSQIRKSLNDIRFLYEPLLSPPADEILPPAFFLGKSLRVPIWVSSMTGGAPMAGTINGNLAHACREFGMGMGLGSCRVLLKDQSRFGDFNVRDIIGPDLPLFANIGIAQVEQMIGSGSWHILRDMVRELRADGLVIHVNPLQEWLQSEGDTLKKAPINTLEKFLDLSGLQIIVKEVGQGMGPESLNRLLHLPIAAVELAAFGGTNFAHVELTRRTDLDTACFKPLERIGHTAEEMLGWINDMAGQEDDLRCNQLIISGGIRNFLDGYYYLSKSRLPALYGQASAFLRYARGDYETLRKYVAAQVNGLKFARSCLRIRNAQ